MEVLDRATGLPVQPIVVRNARGRIIGPKETLGPRSGHRGWHWHWPGGNQAIGRTAKWRSGCGQQGWRGQCVLD